MIDYKVFFKFPNMHKLNTRVGSGSGTLKSCSRIRNKSFRINSTEFDCLPGFESLTSLATAASLNPLVITVGGRKSTFEAWKELLALAKTNIQLAGMYWTLR